MNSTTTAQTYPAMSPRQTVEEVVTPYNADIYLEHPVYKHLSKEVCKFFTKTTMPDRKTYWASWEEFGKEKHVQCWAITTDGYAVGFNENTSRGWTFPVKKLTPEQVEKYLAHDQDYNQYYDIPCTDQEYEAHDWWIELPLDKKFAMVEKHCPEKKGSTLKLADKVFMFTNEK